MMYRQTKNISKIFIGLTLGLLISSTATTKTIFAETIPYRSSYDVTINNGFEGRSYTENNLENLQAISILRNKIGSRISLKELQDNPNLKLMKIKGYIDPTYLVNNNNINALSIGILQNKSVKLSVDGKLLINKISGSQLENNYVTVPITRNKSTGAIELLEITIEYYRIENTPIPDSIDLVYKIPERNNFEINYFRAQDISPPKYENTLHRRTRRSAPQTNQQTDRITDADGDGIDNSWEINGYTWDNKTLKMEKWDPNKHSEAKGFIKYKTSPLAFSTDGDPYGDFAEVSGVKMDSRVKKEGRHPLVAAYPRLKVYIDNFDVVSKQTLTTKTGKSISNTISNSTQQTDSHSFEHSYSESLGFKIGHTFSATPSTNIEFSMNFTTGQSVSDTDTTAVTDSTSEQKTLQWETAITTDTTKAAELKLNLHYENLGTAPISNITPTITISQMGNALSTIKMPTSAQAKTIAAGGRYPHSGNIFVQYENDGRTPIALNINQLNSIMSRNSFEIRTDQVNGEIMKEGTNGQYTVFGSWETYMSRINSVTADISLQLPNKKVKRSKVAAHDSHNNNPEMTLKDALVLAFDARIENNQIYIGEERVESGWMISMSGETQKEIKQQLNAMATPELFSVKLRPNMNILIQKPDSNKSPVIEGAFVSDNGETISVSTLPSLYAIKSVNANVKINGTITNLKLTQSPVKARLWTAPINGALNVDYNSKVSVVDFHGRISKASLQIPYGYTPKKPIGLTYVPARKSFKSDNQQPEINWQISNAFLPGVKALVLRNTLKGVVGPNVEMRIGDHIIKGGMSGSIQKYSGEELYGYIGADEPMTPKLLVYRGHREPIQESGRVFRMTNSPFNHSIRAFNDEYNDKVDVIKFYDATTFKEFDPKSSGLVLYEAVDYKGRSEGFNRSTRWFLDWCRKHDNFGPSSYKFVYYYAPRRAPIHDFDMILTKTEVDRHRKVTKIIQRLPFHPDLDTTSYGFSPHQQNEQYRYINEYSIFDIKKIFDTKAKSINYDTKEQILNNFELSSEGYFSDKVGSELKIIKPSIKHTITDFNNSYDIRTQKTNAKAYLIKVTSEKISSDNLKVKFNNEVSINLGVADTQGFGTVTGATTYSPIHSETFILNANPNDPGKISATVSLGEHNRIKTDSNVEIEILGVFSEDGDAYYKIFDTPYKLQNVGTNSTTTSAITLDSSKFIAKPKGYMLRVTTNGASSDLLRLKIDKATIDLGTSATKNVNGRVASGVDHSGLMFVPADTTTYSLDVTSEFNKEFVDHGYYDIEMVGYYY